MLKQSIFLLSIAAAVSISASAPAFAQETVKVASSSADPILPGKRINNPYDIRWKTEGSDKREAIVDAPEIPGGMAYQVRVKKKKRKVWETATQLPMTTSIEKGDEIMVAFWARSAKPPKGKDVGKISVALQRNIEPYDQIINEEVALEQEWKLYKYTGTANRDFAADKTNLNYNLAHAKQTVEFGRYYISRLDTKTELND